MDGHLTFGLYETVWHLYFRADKSPAQTLRASAAWISAPRPVDAILRPVAA
jgi:hypothetical protein